MIVRIAVCVALELVEAVLRGIGRVGELMRGDVHDVFPEED